MKLNIKDKSTGAKRILVRRGVKPIWGMSDDEIIKRLNLKKKIINRHYEIEKTYHEVSDIYSEELVEFVAEELYDYCQDPEFDKYDEIASRLISKMEDELVEEIYDYDDNALEDHQAMTQGLRGDW